MGEVLSGSFVVQNYGSACIGCMGETPYVVLLTSDQRTIIYHSDQVNADSVQTIQGKYAPIGASIKAKIILSANKKNIHRFWWST